jgi:hypothetical protein
MSPEGFGPEKDCASEVQKNCNYRLDHSSERVSRLNESTNVRKRFKKEEEELVWVPDGSPTTKQTGIWSSRLGESQSWDSKSMAMNVAGLESEKDCAAEAQKQL